MIFVAWIMAIVAAIAAGLTYWAQRHFTRLGHGTYVAWMDLLWKGFLALAGVGILIALSGVWMPWSGAVAIMVVAIALYAGLDKLGWKGIAKGALAVGVAAAAIMVVHGLWFSGKPADQAANTTPAAPASGNATPAAPEYTGIVQIPAPTRIRDPAPEPGKMIELRVPLNQEWSSTYVMPGVGWTDIRAMRPDARFAVDTGSTILEYYPGHHPAGDFPMSEVRMRALSQVAEEVRITISLR